MFDFFNKEKSDFLKKKDKSKKGSIDRDVVKLIDEINSKDDFYTSSSCAGRIVLLDMKSSRKNECNWIFAKHDKVNFKEINDAIKKHSNDRKSNNEKSNNNNKLNKKNNYELWFKQQPLILHVACRDLESAKIFLETARKIFRRAGIIAITERKITIEIIGSEHLETIVADKNFVADKFFLKVLIKYANRNFRENKKKINKFLIEVTNLK